MDNILARSIVEGDTYTCGRVLFGMGPTATRAQGLTPEVIPICEMLDSPAEKKLIVAPRGSGKTLCMRANIARNLIADPTDTILLGGATINHPIRSMQSIQRILKSPKVKRLIGEMEGPTWRSDRFTVANGMDSDSVNSMNAWSPEVPQTGGHWQKRFFDDPINAETMRLPGGMDRALDAFEAAQHLGAPDGAIVVITTNWGDNDLRSWILRGRFGKYEVLDIPAYEKRTSVLMDFRKLNFPVNLPEDYLREQAKSMSSTEFHQNYLNESLGAEDLLFDPKYRETWDIGQELPKMRAHYITTDAAQAKGKSSDFQAYIVWGIDNENRIYELEYYNRRTPIGRFCTDVMDAAQRWNVVRIGVEKTALQVYINEELRRQMRIRQWFCHMRDLDHENKPKQVRAKAIVGRYEAGGILFHPNDLELAKQMSELTVDGPKGLHDDLLDCFTYLPQIVDWQGSAERETPEMTQAMKESKLFDKCWHDLDNPSPEEATTFPVESTESYGDILLASDDFSA